MPASTGNSRSAQPDRGRFHGAGDFLAGGDIGGPNLRRLPDEMANRTGVQTAEITDPSRSITDPNNGGQPELAVGPPDPGSADRRHLPGFPGIFPLRTLPPTDGNRCGAPPASRSTHSLGHYPALP